MRRMQVGANEPCPCGSGKKYIECCLDKGFEFVKNEEDGKVSKRIKFRQSQNGTQSSEKDFLGEMLCKKSQHFESIDDVDESLKKAGAIYRIGPDFEDIPHDDVRDVVPMLGVEFSEDGYSFIRSLFLPKMTLKDLRNVYEILETEKIRVTSFLNDPDLADDPNLEELDEYEDIFFMIVTQDYRRHFNIPEDYSRYGVEVLMGLISFLEGTKLEVLLEIMRRSISDGIFRSIFSDL